MNSSTRARKNNGKRCYEETPYGCGYNIGAEARRRAAQAEKIKKALEEKSQAELEEYLSVTRKAG